MTTETKSETVQEPQELKTPEPQAVDPMRQRAMECNAEVAGILHKFNCRIVPFATIEQVGSGPLQRAILETSYGIIPNS